MINVNVIWKDGLRLTNNSTLVLANNFLKYLKVYQGSIDFDAVSSDLRGLTNPQEQTIGHDGGY